MSAISAPPAARGTLVLRACRWRLRRGRHPRDPLARYPNCRSRSSNAWRTTAPCSRRHRLRRDLLVESGGGYRNRAWCCAASTAAALRTVDLPRRWFAKASRRTPTAVPADLARGHTGSPAIGRAGSGSLDRPSRSRRKVGHRVPASRGLQGELQTVPLAPGQQRQPSGVRRMASANQRRGRSTVRSARGCEAASTSRFR